MASKPKKAKFSCKFNSKWIEKYNEIKEVAGNIYVFYCKICDKPISCEHMGEADVRRHISSDLHKRNRAARMQTAAHMKQLNVTSLMMAENELTSMELKTRRAEVKFAMFIAEHHIPIAVMDHLSILLSQCFPDSKIASSFASKHTKTTCIINDAVAPSLLSSVTEMLKSKPFSISVDGSNDSGLKKINPLAVKIFDVTRQKVLFNLLDICTTSGENAACSETITSAINSSFIKHSLSWSNVVAISMDNTSVNFGKHGGILTRIQKEYCPHIYGMGCPCHIIHNTAEQGYKAFLRSSGFDLEEVAVDLCYWFDKSTKRKSELESYSQFCDIEYKQVLDYCSTRWLCSQVVTKRIIDMYEPLRSYFLSSGQEEKTRFERLKKVFSDPMTIVYLHFYNHTFPVFNDLNILLQRQDPQIYRLHSSMQVFIKKILLKIVDASLITELDIWNCDISSTPLLPDNELNIGSLAEEGLQSLYETGDISNDQKMKFFSSVKAFWTTVHKYATSKLPKDDDVIINSQWINFFQRSEAKFSQVKYFINKFPFLAETPSEMDVLRDEFDDYKTMKDDEIDFESSSVDIEYRDIYGNLVKKKDYEMDKIWGLIGQLKSPTSQSTLRFFLLTRVASAVLIIPHSNADEERVFSSVRKDKTSFRASLDLDRTLSSLLICQLNNDGNCLTYEPSREVILKSKKVTKAYNREHSKEK